MNNHEYRAKLDRPLTSVEQRFVIDQINKYLVRLCDAKTLQEVDSMVNKIIINLSSLSYDSYFRITTVSEIKFEV